MASRIIPSSLSALRCRASAKTSFAGVSAVASSSSSAMPSAAGSSRSFGTTSHRLQAPEPRRTMPLSQKLANTQPPKDLFEQMERYPRHPLHAFFDMEMREYPSPAGATEADAASATPDKRLIPVAVSRLDFGQSNARRSYLTPELRRKSSLELHQLWYLCIIERNKLSTKRAEVGRTGSWSLARQQSQSMVKRTTKVRKTMGRIKFVLNERRIGLTELLKKQQQEQELSQQEPLEEEAVSQVSAAEVEVALAAERLAAAEEASLEEMRQRAEGEEGYSMGSEASAGSEGIKVGGNKPRHSASSRVKQGEEEES